MANEGVNQGRRRFLTATTVVVGSAGSSLCGDTLHRVVGAQRARQKRRRPGARRHQQGGGRPAPHRCLARPAGLDHQSHAGVAGHVATGRRASEGCEIRKPSSNRSTRRNRETSSIKPEWLVVIGICTHLGCSPDFVPDIKPEQHVRPRYGKAASSARATNRATTFPVACSRAFRRSGKISSFRRTSSSMATPNRFMIGVNPERSGVMANIFTQICVLSRDIGDWVNERAPGMMPMYRKAHDRVLRAEEFQLLVLLRFAGAHCRAGQSKILTGIFPDDVLQAEKRGRRGVRFGGIYPSRGAVGLADPVHARGRRVDVLHRGLSCTCSAA